MSTAIRRLVTAGSIAAAALLAVVASNSARWIGTTFPGFLLMQNRVVPSVALPHWARGQARRFFQLEVVAVDGVPTTTAAAIYEQAARRAPGVHVAYTFRHSNGETFTELVPAQVFSASDWVLLFGAYFLTGAAFLAAGAVVMAVKPGGASSLGLVACGTITGLFAFTAADLYGPYWFFRLHVACEAFLGVGLLHLALVFPVVRAHRHRLRILATLYVASGLFAATYETALFEPRAYTAMHLLASATHGAGALALIVSVAYELLTSGSPLIRRKIGVVAAGALSALVVPAIAMGASGLLGGSVPVNLAALTAFLFPASLGYAVVKRDLFEIDAMLRRAITYVALVAALGVLYLLILAILGIASSGVARTPAASAVVNLVLVFLFAPLRNRVQDAVDRVFFRKRYDAEQCLAQLTHELTAARTVEAVVAETERVLAAAMRPASCGVLLWRADGTAQRVGAGVSAEPEAALLEGLRARADRGELLARWEVDEAGERNRPLVWQSFAADLLVPINSGRRSLGLLALGRKASGEAFNLHDAAFLRAVAGQLALALSSARAFGELAALNRQVQERTVELERANAQLNASLEEIQRGQAERERILAVRTRFVVHASHEFRTPLAVVLAAADALDRYGARMTPAQRELRLRKIKEQVQHMKGLLKDVLALGQMESAGSSCRREPVELRRLCHQVLEEAQVSARAAHRLVLALQGDAVPASLDPRLVRQVLQNLLQNAIKYSPDGGTVELGVDRDADGVTFRVRDQGLGIAPADLPHVFETFYRAESVSGIEGTGLGLAIAGRAASLHGGTISVESTPGRGTTFLVRLPHDEPGEANGRAHSAALRCRHDGRLREAPRP